MRHQPKANRRQISDLELVQFGDDDVGNDDDTFLALDQALDQRLILRQGRRIHHNVNVRQVDQINGARLADPIARLLSIFQVSWLIFLGLLRAYQFIL